MWLAFCFVLKCFLFSWWRLAHRGFVLFLFRSDLYSPLALDLWTFSSTFYVFVQKINVDKCGRES